MKKEISNFVIDDYAKNELDDSLKNIIFTIRRFSAQYNRKDVNRRNYNPINRMSNMNQYSPYMEEIFSSSQRSSVISNNFNVDNLKFDDYDNKSVYSTQSLNELNASNRLTVANSRNSLDSTGTNSIHSNSSITINRNSMEEEDENELISLVDVLNLCNEHTNNPSLSQSQPQPQPHEKRNKPNTDISRASSVRSGTSKPFIKIFTTNGRDDCGSSHSSNSPSQNISPMPSPIEPAYVLTNQGDGDTYQSGQYSPNAKKRFPLNMKRKLSLTINSITGGNNHTTNTHRNHGKVTRDFNS